MNMNTITTSAAANTSILAVDFGNYKSVSKPGRGRFDITCVKIRNIESRPRSLP